MLPLDTPVTTPVALPMLATAELPLVHVPPLTVLLNVADEPGQTDVVPLIVPAVAAVLTVTMVVAVADPHVPDTE